MSWNGSEASTAQSTVAVGGFDLVSYQDAAKPIRGNGNHVVVHGGATYLFSGLWNQDVPRRIAEANAKWPAIQEKSPSEL